MFAERPHAYTRSLFIALCAALLALGSNSSLAQDAAPTRGKRFWTGFMQNGFGAQSMKVHVMSTVATSGTVSIPASGWDLPFTVGANSVAVITLPASAENIGSEVVTNKGVLVQTQDSVNVFISSFQNFTHDLSQVLPESSLGNSYRVDAYQGLPNFNNLHKSELLVVATQDGTEVRITPSVNTLAGAQAGIPFTVALNAGQTYQVHAATDNTDLTGTLVEATEASGTCRPFAVLGGSTCAAVPTGCSACDAVFEQLLPRSAWGTRYFTSPVNGVSGSTYRILADEDNTLITIGNGAPFVLNAGQRHEVNGATSPVCIQANKPVSVAQLLEGYSCSGNGDPSMLLLSPAERRSTSASFHTSTSSQITQHSIGLVVEPGAVGQITLNGNAISPALFQGYPGCTDRMHAKLTIPAGVHQVQSPSGFQLYLYGMGYGESYATAVHNIGGQSVPQDSTVCGAGIITLNAPEPLTNAQWTAASAPATILGSGNSLTVSPTSSESYLVTGLQAITGCPSSFTFNVGVPLTIPTLLTANNAPTISICQYEPVQLALAPPPDPAWFNIQWSPAYALDDATSTSPLAMPLSDTWFTVSVTSPSGCGDMVDSIFVAVAPGSILSLSTQTDRDALCSGESAQLTSQALRVIASDRFNSAPSSMWAAIQGGVVSNDCGSHEGSALYFNGNGQRVAQTIGLNMSGGGELRFHLKIANGTAPCDDADPGEDIRLEYSTNNGLSWVPITTFAENAFPVFTPTTVSIPAGAQTTNTMFRLRQLAHSGTGQDNWAIDVFLVARWDNNWLNYAWTPGPASTPGLANTAVTPTMTGWHVLTGTDPGSGCAYSDSVHIQVDPVFSLSVTSDTTLCDIAGITLTATPSFATNTTYQWAPANGSLSATTIANPIANPQSTTTYTVNATSASGCTATGQVTVTVGQLLGLNVTAESNTLCQGQSTQLTALASGGNTLNYSWSGAGLNDPGSATPIATPGQTTTYTCTVTDATSGCSLNNSVTVVVNTGYTADAGPDLTVCSTLGHPLDVQHNIPNASYTWSPAANLNSASIQSPSITVDTTATYTVTVSDPFGCSISDTVTITQAFADTPAQQVAAACANTPPVLNAPTTGVSYLWSNGATTPSIIPTSSGNYTLTISDAQGCEAVTTFNVTLFPMPIVDLGQDVALCGAAAYAITAGNAGNNVVWNTGATTSQINVTSSGTYSVNVTTPNGCTASDEVNVQFHALPTDALQDAMACETDPPTLNAGNPGSTYLWSTGQSTQTILADQSGAYSVTVTTPQNCTATFDANVVLAQAVSVTLGNDTSLCTGQTLELATGQVGNNHLWNTGATTPTLTVSSAGTYSVTVDNGMCSASASINVALMPIPQDVLGDVTHCADTPITLDAGNPGSQYAWSTGATSQTIVPTHPGDYSVLITGVNGCSATSTATVVQFQPPVVQLGMDTVLCNGQTLLLHAGNTGSTYLWNTGSTQEIIAVQQPGTYSVTVTNGPCQRSDEITVLFNPSPNNVPERRVFRCLEDEPRQVTLDAGNPGSSYHWDTGATGRTIVVGAYGWYPVEITNAYGCTLRDSVLVAEYCPSTLYVPNTFTPNGDGINDVFMAVGKNLAVMELQIYDRWGTLLFESRDPGIGWDGTYRGEVVKNDMYTWKIRYRHLEDPNGRLGMEQEQRGHVQVLL